MLRRSQTADVLRKITHYVIIECISLVTSFYFPALFSKTVQFQRHLVFLAENWRTVLLRDSDLTLLDLTFVSIPDVTPVLQLLLRW